MQEDQVRGLILEGGDLISFLKELTEKEKRSLRPYLKELRELVMDYEEVRGKKDRNGYRSTRMVPTHTDAQRNAMQKACFVCFTKAEARQYLSPYVYTQADYIEEILPWYTPSWFSDLVKQDIAWVLDYQNMMALKENGFLELDQEMIMATLTSAIIEKRFEGQKNGRHKRYYNPKALEQYPETLAVHIWHLFEEESTINNYYDYLNLENYQGGKDIWAHTIKNLVEEGKLERERVLIATILTATKGFNKNLSGWFYDLLIQLEPQESELIALQDELFTALQSPHSKLINAVLKYFKSLTVHADFKQDVFVDQASILLNSSTKSVVNSTLMILDKLAKLNPELRPEITKVSCEALLNNDEKIQIRAAKIIAKYTQEEQDELSEELSIYAANTFSAVRELLSPLMVSNTPVFEDEQEEGEILIDRPILSDEHRIDPLAEFDDLLFFVSQSIDNNEVYHLDLLMSYLPKLHRQINAENVDRLEPLLIRAVKLKYNMEASSRIGYLEQLAAQYLCEFASYLQLNFPHKLGNFERERLAQVNRLSDHSFYRNFLENSLKDFEDQTLPDYIYVIHKRLFQHSLFLIENKLELSLLSTPSHAPCWLDPEVLVSRILQWEEKGKKMELYDFQLALGRTPLNLGLKLPSRLQEVRHAEIRNVIGYHLGDSLLDLEEVKKPELWLPSVISHGRSTDLEAFQNHIGRDLKRELALYQWKSALKEETYSEYDYAERKSVKRTRTVKALQFTDFYDAPKARQKGGIHALLKAFKSKKHPELNTFYGYLRLKKQKYVTSMREHDDLKFLYLSPQNPDALLAEFIHYSMRRGSFWGESEKRTTIQLLGGLFQLWRHKDLGEMNYLFLAASCVSSDKVARELAAELWIDKSAKQILNQSLFGEVLGRLEYVEYAPLKRFTDLISNSILNLSKAHNRALLEVLDFMMSKMNPEPLRGTKKLLELCVELNSQAVDYTFQPATHKVWEEWSTQKSLQGIIKKLLK